MQTRTIAITSGKGGVGKTNFSVNLSIALAQKGKKVLLMDADFGLANVDILLNLRPKHTIESLVSGEANAREILNHFSEPDLQNLKVICASSGIPEMTDISSDEMKFIIGQLSSLQSQFDYFIIDTGAGISGNILRFNASVEELFIVTTPEPSALTDAYAMIKVMHAKHQRKNFCLVVNQATPKQAESIHTILLQVAKTNYLSIEIELLGNISNDRKLVDAVKHSRPLILHIPQAIAAEDYRRISRFIDRKTDPEATRNQDKGLWKKFFEWSKTHS